MFRPGANYAILHLPLFLAFPQASDDEVVSETEDETQGELLQMPNLMPSSDDLFNELERYVAVIKESRVKDLEDCQRIESLIVRYKVTRNDEKKKAAAALNNQLMKAEASLGDARDVILAVVSLA